MTKNELDVAEEAWVELVAAVQQMAPADDQIICNHVRRAEGLLRALVDDSERTRTRRPKMSNAPDGSHASRSHLRWRNSCRDPDLAKGFSDRNSRAPVRARINRSSAENAQVAAVQQALLQPSPQAAMSPDSARGLPNKQTGSVVCTR